jgi:hypothetical protein
MDDSAAGDVAVVMAVSWGREGGEEWASGAPGVGGASAWSVPRSRGRSSDRECLVVEGSGMARVFPCEILALRCQRWRQMYVS